jgi:hypothetical protein
MPLALDKVQLVDTETDTSIAARQFWKKQKKKSSVADRFPSLPKLIHEQKHRLMSANFGQC